MEDKDYKIILQDETGKEIHAHIIAGFQHKERDFLVLDLSEKEELEFILMELKEDNIVPIENEEEYIQLCELFETEIWSKLKEGELHAK